MWIRLTVPNMACSACSETITKAIQVIDSTAIVETDLKTKIVSVNTAASATAIQQAITSAGYTIT